MSLLISLDLLVAVNTVHVYSILLGSLYKLGIGGTILQLFCTSLSGKPKRGGVKRDHCSSPWPLVYQQSVVSAMQFNIHMKQLKSGDLGCGVIGMQCYLKGTMEILSMSGRGNGDG